jgi:hypothetical protein
MPIQMTRDEQIAVQQIGVFQLIQVARSVDPPEGDVATNLNDQQDQPSPHGRIGPDTAHVFQKPVNRQCRSVQRAPDDVNPVGAMPQPAQQHRNHQVEVRAEFSFFIAAQRDVEVVAQPGGQRNMPPLPEVLDGDGLVRAPEVFGQLKPEQQRQTDRHVGIPGKIAVNLDRVAVYAHQVFKARIQSRDSQKSGPQN